MWIVAPIPGHSNNKKGRVAWGINGTRGNKMLIIGIYGPKRGDKFSNIQFFEEEVFSILDKTT